MTTLNEIWKEWQRTSHNDDIDFISVWCYLAGYFGGQDMGKDGEEYLRKLLGMIVKSK